jgi:hypothetical protein
MLRKIPICLALGAITWLVGGGGCSHINPFQDLIDHYRAKEREGYYRDRGYDSKAARRAAEEDEMFDWFQKR